MSVNFFALEILTFVTEVFRHPVVNDDGRAVPQYLNFK